MRRTTSKSRKTNDEPEEQTNSVSLQMELELLAVKAKNAELTKAHAKLTHENSEMKNEILTLRGELVDMQTRSSVLEAELEKLVQNMSKCTPSLIDMLNLFLQATDSRKSNIVRIFNRFSDKGCTPKSKAITHTVKPHTVNGTVLNLNPTISLTRLNPVNNQRSDEEPSSSTSNIDYRNSLPSTSFNDNHTGDIESGSEIPDFDHSFAANDDFVLRTSQVKGQTLLPALNNLDFSAQMEVENEVEPEEEDSLDSSPMGRLSTIHEESVCSTSGQTRTSLGEIRIYLSRLSAEDMHTKKFLNDSCTSTEANVNDTCFNIETTVIENQEALVSKRLRADIMVFSPHTNSTRLDTSLFDNLSPRRAGCTDGGSAVQSPEVTPSSGSNEHQGNKGDTSLLPTPSMSAMGDIDRSNYSRLDILTETDRKASPIVLPSSPLNTKTRFRKKRKTDNEYQSDGDSPRSSRGSQNENRVVTSFVCRQRGGSSDSICTSTINLETLANDPMVPGHTQSLAVNHDNDSLKENENIPNNESTRSKRSKTKSTNKSPKRSVKRKKTGNSNDFQEKIKQIQIRLSNYVPESSVNPPESPENNMSRPARAAKPKVLKDSSFERSDNICTPTIMETLANSPDEHRPTQSLAMNHDRDPPKENKNLSNNESTRSKRSKTKSTNKSPKQNVKRKKTGNSNSNDLEEKIKEIQIRLSSYVPESSVNSPESPKNQMSRPSRAAKPKDLKDASLKVKLRRMF